MEKRTILILSLLILSINFVNAVQVVQQPTDNSEPTTHWYSFLANPLFWGIIIIVFLVFGILIAVVFLLRWLIKFLKQRNDIFYKMRADRMALAKTHSRYPAKHWWKVDKNTPIRLVKKDQHGKYSFRILGYHRGDYLSHEGNLNIALNLADKKKWFLFPVRDILVILNKEKVTITHRDNGGKKIKEEVYEMPKAEDIVQFNENEILLFAEGVSKVGLWLIPVLKDKEGQPIDVSLPTYAKLKEVLLGDYLYEQSNEFVTLSKKAMDLNPQIRGMQKVSDSNQNVEINGGNQQQ